MAKRQMYAAVRPYWEAKNEDEDDRRTGGGGDDNPRPTAPAGLTPDQWRELEALKAELVALAAQMETGGCESRPKPEYAPVRPYWDTA